MRYQQGVVLVAALLIISVVFIMVIGASFTSVIDRTISGNQQGASAAYYLADAGLQKYKTAAFQTYAHYLKNPHIYGTSYGCNNPIGQGLDLNRDGVIDASDLRPGDKRTESLGAGSYTISYRTQDQYMILESVGSLGRAQARVQLVAELANGGGLANAIWAGNGAADKRINGGAQIYGSAYITGSDPNASVLDTGGNFAMHNYYTASDLQKLIKDKDGQVSSEKVNFLRFDGVNQRDLCARLRVRDGTVSLSGSTKIGSDNAPSGYKGSLAGAHVGSSGYNVDESGSFEIYADEKTGFKLDDIDFPVLDTDGRGKKFCETDASKTWRECLHAEAGMTITPTSISPIDATCYLGLQSVRINKADTPQFGRKDIDCAITNAFGETVGFEYDWDDTAKQATFRIHGLVNIKGLNLEFEEDTLIRYEGKSSLFVEKGASGSGGSVFLRGSLLPRDSFPSKDVLGIIAEKDIIISGDKQNNLPVGSPTGQAVAGVFYAGNTAYVEKGATVFGTVVAPNVCASSSCNAGQSPKFVQVAGLENNLTPGFSSMKGASLATYRLVSFERK